MPIRNRMVQALGAAIGLLFLPAAAGSAQLPAASSGAATPRISTPTEAFQRGLAALIVSPEVQADRRVTFRLYAPEAREVSVAGEFTKGVKLAMSMDDKGVWSVVTDPIAPEQYFYMFTVDGVTMPDPRNPRNNSLIVPGAATEAFDVKDIPHGDLRQVWYRSSTSQLPRRIFVYTPPGYERAKDSYPVLYLLHGWGGDEEEWTNAGFVPEIMDNLLAEKKIKPMIVVMPNGHPDEQAAPHLLPAPPQSALPSPNVSERHTLLSEKNLLEDIIPFIEANYRVYTDRDRRAIAGLSMGGEQASFIGLNHLDRFSWVGAFSAAYVMLPGHSIQPDSKDSSISQETFDRNFSLLDSSANKKLHLLYISCGLDDPLLKADRDMKAWLSSKQIRFVDIETPGYAHVWRYWRVSLIDFAPRLFR